MNQEKRILVCEDSMEGIFSAVYDGIVHFLSGDCYRSE